MVLDLLSNLTAIIMLIGIIVGAVISPRMSHKIGYEYNRGEVIFRKKLEYFEKILETIENNKRAYNIAIKKIGISKNKSAVKEIVAEMKQQRMRFLPMSSPLYMDTRNISEKVIRFVRVEGIIFNRIEGLVTKNKKEVKLITAQLEKDLEILTLRGNEILFEMRKETKK